MKIFSPFNQNTFMRKMTCILVFLLVYCIGSIEIHAQEHENDQTCSPYFFVQSEDNLSDRLPLKETSAKVDISGVIADVTVQQTYCNEGEKVLEAVYVFPASTRAAVYSMKMQLGDRIITAKIEEKEKAREQYEEAREQGQTASLLEEERPNVFKMNVANIMPGDTIEITLKYTELLIPTEGTYEFVYPAVVGPRYVSPTEDSTDAAFAGQPYQHEGEKPLYDFSVNVNIQAGIPIKNIICSSHDSTAIVTRGDAGSCRLLSKKEGNRDFILQYQLAGNEIATGLLLYEGKEENFFLSMIQPPKIPDGSDIPPRDYLFIMDVSGSMHGYPIDISKVLLEDLISNLRISDRFNILFFAGGSYVLSEKSLPATLENKEMAIQAIENHQGGGGTELLSALERALKMEGTEDYSRSFVIVTDGYVTVERQAFDLIRGSLNEANFFPFGIGTSVNRYLIEGIAHAGMAEPMVTTSQSEAPEKAEQFRQYIQNPVLTNIESHFKGFEVYDVEPLSIPDVMAERPVLLFGKWKGTPAGSIKISGLTGNRYYDETLQVESYAPSPANKALKYLWARKRIQIMDDYHSVGGTDSSLVRKITDLGLTYNLLTRYTSFIAIDSLIRNEGDSIVTVSQPLPMPEGVGDNAVGESAGGGAYSSWGYAADAGRNHSGNYTTDIAGGKDIRPKGSSKRSHIARCYPNPFDSETKLELYIAKEDCQRDKWITLFNIHGQLIDKINISSLRAGKHEIHIDLSQDAPNLVSGVYFARLKIGSQCMDAVRLHRMKN